MAYNFLVVDDEQHARETVAGILTELNGEGVYTAENGAAALKLMDGVPVDAVITDIMMPMMDGITLLKNLYKRKERVSAAVLSGYDEFDYAQTAMSYGAIDYILKPVKRSDIVKLYYKMMRKIKSRESLEGEIAELLHRSNEIKPYIRQRYYSDLVNGGLSDGAPEDMRSFLGLNMRNAPIRIALIEIDEGESGLRSGSDADKISLYKLIEIMEDIIAGFKDCDYFSVSNNTIAVVWCPQGDINDTAELVSSLELMSGELSELYKVVLNIGLSKPVSGPLEASQADESAREAIRHKLLYGSGQIFNAETLEHDAGEVTLSFDTNGIVESIWLNHPERATELMSGCFSALRQGQGAYRLSSIQLFCQKLFTDCMMVLERECGGVDEFCERANTNLLETRFANHSLNEVETFFRQLITDICAQIGKSRKNEHKMTITQAKQLVMSRYASDIGIESIAKELHYSKNYFGQLFKAETGMSVNEYKNQVRVQKAKELLATGQYRIYQIAEMVGFNDQQYFARIFKKAVGCMPSEYIP